MQEHRHTNKPPLEAPGAGIPGFERKLIYGALKIMSLMKDKDTLADLFLTESDRIITLVDPVDDALLTQRVLIDRLRGIEDSSRDWSAMMTLDHLNIVNNGIIGIIKNLLHSEAHNGQLPEVKIEDVKPDENAGVGLIDAFALNNQDMLDQINKIRKMKPSAKHVHPWFGPCNAKFWLCLMAVHMKLHRKQIEQILQQLNQ